MKKLMHMLFLSCLKATELIEKKFLFGLSLKEKLQLKMHKSMCDACSLYEKQSSVLDSALAKRCDYDSVKVDLEAFKVELVRKMGDMN